MTHSELLSQRLFNQQISTTDFKTPQQLVEWFGAMQAQDYTGAKWAVGQRLKNVTDANVEEAFNKGEILRTHLMRPTWHFVGPHDIRWILKISSPQVKRLMSYYNKKLGLTQDIFKDSQRVFSQTLKGKKDCTRQELSAALNDKGIKVAGQALGHIVMEAELDGLICSGPRRGKQFTYMLLEERVPSTNILSHEESLSRLATVYFQSHGPATLKDFCWWSGLRSQDARKGIEMNKKLKSETFEKNTYWFFDVLPHPIPTEVFLLPNYDELGIAYKIRDAFIEKGEYVMPPNAGQMPFSHLVFYKGKLVGLWKRTFLKNSLEVEVSYFRDPSQELKEEVNKAIDMCRKFYFPKKSI